MNPTGPDGPPGLALRQRLAAGFVVAPAVYDGLTARIAERAGFEACHVTAAGVAAQLGAARPQLLDPAEVVDHVRYLCEAVAIPVVVELAGLGGGDDGRAARVVAQLEAAGVAGLVVTPGPGLDDLRAVLDARTDVVVLAHAGDRAGAVAGHEAGADLVVVAGAPPAALAALAAAVPTAVLDTSLPTAEAARLGARLHLAGAGHELSEVAVRAALQRARDGRSAERTRNELRFDDLTSLLGLPEVYELEARYATSDPGER